MTNSIYRDPHYELGREAEITRLNLTTQEAQEGRPRVAIFATYNITYSCIAGIARKNWIAYAERHGYGLRFYPWGYHEDISEPATYGDKGKYQWFFDLRGHTDIAMFLDIDSLFMNHDIRVEDLIGDEPFFWTYDDSGPLSGLWMARTDERTCRILGRAYEIAARDNNVRHGKIEPNGISDQDAMTKLMGVPPFKSLFGNCHEAKRAGHTFPENYEPGDWIIGFPGRTVAEKMKGMAEYAEIARGITVPSVR